VEPLLKYGHEYLEDLRHCKCRTGKVNRTGYQEGSSTVLRTPPVLVIYFLKKKLSVAVVNKASRADCASCFTILNSMQIACSKKACCRVKNCIAEILLRAL